MDILDKLANALRALSKFHGGPVALVADEALAEYERVRARTVVLTFEKAVPIATGAFAILNVRQGEPSLNVFCAGGVDPEEGEYAYCQLTHLPGPEVFK